MSAPNRARLRGHDWSPRWWLALREHLELWRVLLSLRRSVPQPAAATAAVLLVPGFLVGDWSLRPMSRWLRRRGYRTFASGIRMNIGCTRAMVDRLEARLVELAAVVGPVHLVGHSRGGTLARLVAGRRPDLVGSLTTLGSPLTDQFDASRSILRVAERIARSNPRGRPSRLGQDCLEGACAAEVAQELAQPLVEGLRFVSVHTRGDGIVRWQSCLAPEAEQVRVRGSHNGLASNRRVYRVLQHSLGEPGDPVPPTQNVRQRPRRTPR